MNYSQLLTIAFIGNGATLLGIKIIERMTPGANHRISALLAMYLTASVLCLFFMWKSGKKIELKSVLVGAMGGIGSAIGLAFNLAAVSYLPGYIVFPIISGGIILVVVLIGRAVFKERVGPYGVWGIIFGVAAIVILGLKDTTFHHILNFFKSMV